jgi:hypothetical protein
MDANEKYVKALPERMPEPTYWPFVFAVSLLFLGWGLLTIWVISAAGIIGMIISIRGWIKDLLYERGKDNGKQEELPG